jgi:hypothetical protein
MKTLLYTSIYSNLWGTKFGGRPSRELHYKHSLLTILNLTPDKVICFTNQEQVEDLKLWFYEQNNISPEKLEFIIFELSDSKYHKEIQEIKNGMVVKSDDRCHEVQYNKFFWIDLIPNIESYDRVFWIDAGLSHGGIFPEQYTYGNGYEKHFNVKLFNSEFLNKIENLTENKLLVLSKNNTGSFFWSQTIPRKYYNEFNNSEHIIGGLFGGKVNDLLKLKSKFEELLEELIKNESELYFEELIMSCIYGDNKSNYISLKFDDWYDRQNPEVYGKNVKYFYNMFEPTKVCLSVLSIEKDDLTTRYLDSAKKLIKTNLKFNNYDILVLTNNVSYFSDINDSRLILIDYNSNFLEPIKSAGMFNMHLKRYPIKIAKDLGYEIIYYNDCDCYIVGWDSENFKEKCNEDFDVAFVSSCRPQLGGLRKEYEHFQNKVTNEFGDLYYDELDQSPNPAETRVIFKNSEKLNTYLNFWNKISERNKEFVTYYDGVYFGTSAIHSKMVMTSVTDKDDFSKYCRISHGDGVLDYFGRVSNENNEINLN